MLKWIVGSKVDHPLADPKEARALLSGLPAHDSVKALDEITRWLQSLAHTDGLKLERLLEIAELLDSAAKNHQRKVVQDYLAMSRQQKAQEQKLWTSGFNFAKALGDIYELCVSLSEKGASGAGAVRKQLPVVVARALRALALQVKWTLLRYGPFEGRIWSSIGKLYGHAEGAGYANTSVTIYPGLHGTGTVRLEYLKVLMLWASGADVLPPLKQEIAERAVAHFAPAFRLEKGPYAGALYYFDPARDKAPARLLGTMESAAGLHFFGPGDAQTKVTQALPVVEKTGALPAEVNLGVIYPTDITLGVFKHLAVYWSDQPPKRGAERHASTGRITVVPGYSQLLDELEREESDALNFSVRNAESWVVENMSDKGYGALVPAASTDWIRVGELIGVQVEGSTSWSAALVRRVVRDEKRQYHVGIEAISRTSVLVRVAYSSASRDPENAVLLSNKPDAQGEVGMLMRAGRFEAAASLEVTVNDKPYLLMPSRMIDTGEDYDWGMYKVLRRET